MSPRDETNIGMDVTPRLMSSLKAASYADLFDVVREAFDLWIGTSGWAREDWPVLTQEYPKASLTDGPDTRFDVIVFHLVKAEIASTSNQAERKPKGMWGVEVSPHPTKARYQVLRVNWWESVEIQFSVYAKTNKRADELVNWFHRMLMVTIGMKFFKARGINEFRFDHRMEDKKTQEFGGDLYFRGLRYILRLELNETAEVKTLESVTLSLPESSRADGQLR